MKTFLSKENEIGKTRLANRSISGFLIKLATAYSTTAANTYAIHNDILNIVHSQLISLSFPVYLRSVPVDLTQISMAITYDTMGKAAAIEARWEVIVRTVVIPKLTRAGVADIDIQNDIQLSITISVVGT